MAERGAAAAAEHFGELQLGGDAAGDIAVRAGDPGGSPILVLGLLIGEKLAGAAAGPHGPGVGGTVGSKIARLAVVVGEVGGVLVEPVGVEVLDGGRHAAVHAGAPDRRQPVEHGGAHQAMPEPEPARNSITRSPGVPNPSLR